MKHILFYILLIGLISCSTNNKEQKTIDKNAIEKPEKITITSDEKPEYHQIVLSENSLDTFSIPFPEKNQLTALRNYYEPYWVEGNIGQQDGPDYRYIDIARNDENPIAFLNFEPENELKLDEIRIVDSTATDQYGIRVGDTYQQVIEKRNSEFKNSTNYHQHTYLYTDSSNIYYELTGDFTMTEAMLENLEELVLSEEQLQKCKVEYIIWRNK